MPALRNKPGVFFIIIKLCAAVAFLFSNIFVLKERKKERHYDHAIIHDLSNYYSSSNNSNNDNKSPAH